MKDELLDFVIFLRKILVEWLKKLFESFFKNEGTQVTTDTSETKHEDSKEGVETSSNDTKIGSLQFSLTEIFSNPFLLWPCIAFAVWDAITTVIGTMAVLGGNSFISIIAAGLVTSFTTAILFNAFPLLKLRTSETASAWFKILIIAVVIYDLFTSYYGAKYATFSGESGELDSLEYSMTFAKGFVVLMLTGLAVGATLICSRLFYEKRYSQPTQK